MGLAADLADLDACRGLIDRALDALGGLDILVNNAAVGDARRLRGIGEALWRATMDINLRAPFFLTQRALPALREAGGNVVMVSSVSGLMGHPEGVSVYCASKGGLNNMTRALALELAGEVRVNAIAPGPIDTDMHRLPARASGDEAGYFEAIDRWVPMGRIGTAEEIAAGILYLASRRGGLQPRAPSCRWTAAAGRATDHGVSPPLLRTQGGPGDLPQPHLLHRAHDLPAGRAAAAG